MRVPEEIYHNIIMYKSAEGAQITVLEYNLLITDWRQSGWTEADHEIVVGDTNV